MRNIKNSGAIDLNLTNDCVLLFPYPFMWHLLIPKQTILTKN